MRVSLVACAAFLLQSCYGFNKQIDFEEYFLNELEKVEGSTRVGRSDEKQSWAFHFYKDQKLDHYAAVTEEDKRWSQRVIFDGSFCKTQDCPLFVTTTYGGGLRGPSSIHLYYALAEKYGGAVLSVEHRYYGVSHPTPDMSLENLEYLHSEQQMYDMAEIITALKEAKSNSFEPAITNFNLNNLKNSRVVAIGCSYPGVTVNALKQKFSGLIDGSISCGAPVEAHVNFIEYAQVVGHALGLDMVGGSQECYNIVKEGTKQLAEIMDNNFQLTDSLVPSKLAPCSPFNTTLDRDMYQSEVFGAFQGLVQYNNIKLAQTPPGFTNVRTVCEAAIEGNAAGGPLAGLAKAHERMSGGTCMSFDSFEDIASIDRDVNFNCEAGCTYYRQWLYQTCNEFGYMQTTEGSDDSHPFAALTGVSWELWGKKRCNDAFGMDLPLVDFRERTRTTNIRYGARDMGTTNVTSLHGGIDPWHALGIVPKDTKFYNSCGLDQPQQCYKQETDPDHDVVFIPNTAHCMEYYVPANLTDDSGNLDKSYVISAVDQIEINVAKYIRRDVIYPLIGSGSMGNPTTAAPTTAPIDPTPPTAPTPPPSDCEDAKHWCSNSLPFCFTQSVQFYCPKTCGVCDKVPARPGSEDIEQVIKQYEEDNSSAGSNAIFAAIGAGSAFAIAGVAFFIQRKRNSATIVEQGKIVNPEVDL